MDTSRSLSESRRIALELRGGDQSSFWRLTDVLRPYLKQVIRSQLKGKFPEKFDESDVVQAALAQAVQHIDQFHGRTEREWKAWLAEICRNETKNAIRHWLRLRRNVDVEKSLSSPESIPMRDQGVSETERKELAVKLMKGIESLNEEQQRLIRLRHVANMPHSDVARELGITEAAARRRWFVTISKLKDVLKNLESDS